MLDTPRIPQPVLTELRAIAGPENLRLADGELAVYARDATPLFHGMPDAVVAPADTEQVARILRLAAGHGIPVVPRGAGSNLCAGTVPLAGGIVLTTVRMSRMLEVAPQ
jgi:glycolate oxidase